MAYLAKGYGRLKFNPQRLNRGLELDKIFFKNITKIELIYPKYHRNMRWLANYYMPVIRYWNPKMEFNINHRAFDEEPQIILHTNVSNDNKNEETEKVILKPYSFIHDQLFEQIIEIEKGANPIALQQEALSLHEKKND